MDSTTRPFAIHLILYFLFFLSGIAALIYQVMWQRMLFTLFGIDLQSITIIVSVFMFGLGIGGIWGGMIADRMPSRLLMLYTIIELGIALFGFCSFNIILFLGNATSINSETVTALLSFLILAFPTFLMGATLPILVTHVNQYIQNVGSSVGGLYFINTLGGAIGAYASGFIFLYWMNLVETIYCAAFINLAIAVIAFLVFRRKT